MYSRKFSSSKHSFYIVVHAEVGLYHYDIMLDFHTKVGLRLLRPSADNPISGKVQEQIDAEVDKILTVRKFWVDLHSCHPAKPKIHEVGSL